MCPKNETDLWRAIVTLLRKPREVSSFPANFLVASRRDAYYQDRERDRISGKRQFALDAFKVRQIFIYRSGETFHGNHAHSYLDQVEGRTKLEA